MEMKSLNKGPALDLPELRVLSILITLQKYQFFGKSPISIFKCISYLFIRYI